MKAARSRETKKPFIFLRKAKRITESTATTTMADLPPPSPANDTDGKLGATVSKALGIGYVYMKSDEGALAIESGVAKAIELLADYEGGVLGKNYRARNEVATAVSAFLTIGPQESRTPVMKPLA